MQLPSLVAVLASLILNLSNTPIILRQKDLQCSTTVLKTYRLTKASHWCVQVPGVQDGVLIQAAMAVSVPALNLVVSNSTVISLIGCSLHLHCMIHVKLEINVDIHITLHFTRAV